MMNFAFKNSSSVEVNNVLNLMTKWNSWGQIIGSLLIWITEYIVIRTNYFKNTEFPEIYNYFKKVGWCLLIIIPCLFVYLTFLLLKQNELFNINNNNDNKIISSKASKKTKKQSLSFIKDIKNIVSDPVINVMFCMVLFYFIITTFIQSLFSDSIVTSGRYYSDSISKYFEEGYLKNEASIKKLKFHPELKEEWSKQLIHSFFLNLNNLLTGLFGLLTVWYFDSIYPYSLFEKFRLGQLWSKFIMASLLIFIGLFGYIIYSKNISNQGFKIILLSIFLNFINAFWRNAKYSIFDKVQKEIFFQKSVYGDSDKVSQLESSMQNLTVGAGKIVGNLLSTLTSLYPLNNFILNNKYPSQGAFSLANIIFFFLICLLFIWVTYKTKMSDIICDFDLEIERKNEE